MSSVLKSWSLVCSKAKTSLDSLFGSRCLLWTNVGLSFALSGLGDALQQQVEARKESGEKSR